MNQIEIPTAAELEDEERRFQLALKRHFQQRAELDADRALKRAEQQHRICRLSNRSVDDTFRRDQVRPDPRFTSHLDRLRIPLPAVC